ncbi:MAG: imidazoleglycerol-phosphate dehydratase HisB [Eubacteriales bacterium]
MRTAEINRKTAETDISLSLQLDGQGECQADTGVGFLDHMLTLFAKHGNFDLRLTCRGDLKVDAHHTAEDIAICLGRAFREAAGDCRGICRYGDVTLPMDEALVLCAVDFGGRSFLSLDLPLPAKRVGDFDTELLEEFLQAFTRNAAINLHLMKLKGKNTHHLMEAAFKALARALRRALTIDEQTARALPTTKGVMA